MNGRGTFDAVIVGGGHNGLVAATLIARAGRSVLVLERRDQLGGAAVSGSPWPGVGARVSRYSYLVSLFPSALTAALGLKLQLRTRRISSYTPVGDRGLLVRAGELDWLSDVAGRVAPTLIEPLRSRQEIAKLLGNDAWLLDRPLSEVVEPRFDDDVVRGIVLTDATIGTFAPADDALLRQNRCFLYHVIGDGTGLWKVPVGGMGALTGELEVAARAAGAGLRTDAEVTAVASDHVSAEITCADGSRYGARHVVANVAPTVLTRLLGEPPRPEQPEGSQLKINMLLKRLPKLRDPAVTSEDAFAGTFHVNESYAQLQTAYEQAASGRIPALPPCELYCHSLTDPTILSDDLRAAGAQTLTLFGLHMPARLFREAPEEAKRAAVEATLQSVDSVLAEPLADCLWEDGDGAPCLEAVTPVELEQQLGMPGGHIFHRDLAWPFAEDDRELGGWGAETELANVWVCGAGARRGGGVSGISGHNAARAVLAALDQ